MCQNEVKKKYKPTGTSIATNEVIMNVKGQQTCPASMKPLVKINKQKKLLTKKANKEKTKKIYGIKKVILILYNYVLASMKQLVKINYKCLKK